MKKQNNIDVPDIAALTERAAAAALKKGVNVPRSYKPQRFELGFTTAGLHPSVNAAHVAVQWWLNDIIAKHPCIPYWLTIFGKSGTGKTHLARAACETLRAHGRKCWWLPADNLAARIHCREWHRLEWYKLAPILILDDLGAAYDDKGGFMSATVYSILAAREKKWTLLTTNLAPAQLAEAYDSRLASRLKRHGGQLADLSAAADYCWNN